MQLDEARREAAKLAAQEEIMKVNKTGGRDDLSSGPPVACEECRYSETILPRGTRGISSRKMAKRRNGKTPKMAKPNNSLHRK